MVRSFYYKIWFYLSIGLINIAVFTVFYAVNSKPPVLASAASVNQALYTPKAIQLKQGTPTRVVIPSLSIDTPIKTGLYNPTNDSWAIDSQHAFYAEASVPTNNKRGDTLVYGHRIPAIFERLVGIKLGDEATIYTDTGYIFHYKYISRDEVDPTNTSIFSSFGPPTLTLQTCSGSWDQLRMLYSFKLLRVDKL